MSRAIGILFVVFGIPLLVGCSTFDRDWDAMAAAETTVVTATGPEAGPETGPETGPESGPETGVERAPDAGIEGRWRGTWHSDANGHHGALRCVLTTDGSGTLHARYHATYGPFFTFEYVVPMTLRKDGDTYHFTGEADLGWLAGGRYEYAGTVVGDEFSSTYRSARDHGTFRMSRVE